MEIGKGWLCGTQCLQATPWDSGSDSCNTHTLSWWATRQGVQFVQQPRLIYVTCTWESTSKPSSTTKLGEGSGPQRLVCRIPCSWQAQCTSRRNFAPFPPSTQRAFHGERADKSDCGGLGDRCEIRSAKTRHNTNCINQGNIKQAQGCCPWSPPQGGARDQSASARRGLPSRREARALHH